MQRTEVKRKKSKMVLKYFLSYWADCFINDDSDKSNSKKNSIIFINNQDQWPYCQYLNSLMWCIHLKSLSSIFILFLLWYTSIIHGTLELCLLSSFFFPIIHLSKFRPSSKPQTQPQEIQSSSSEQFTVLPAQEKIEQE